MLRIPVLPLALMRAGLVVLALAVAAPVAADAGRASIIPSSPNLRLIGVGDGLPSSYINGIVADRSGYIWLATFDGLARYDGVDMRVWRHDPDDPGSLPGNHITVVHVDARDRVWVAVEGRGLSVLDARRKDFRHYTTTSHPRIGSDDVWAIASHNGAIWFGTFGGGLHRLAADGTITRFMPRDGDPRSLPAQTVLSLTVDSRGRLWVGTTGGLARWTGRDFQRVALPGEAPDSMVYSVTADGDALWIGARSGLFRLQVGAGAPGRWTRPQWAAMFEWPNAVFSVIAGDAGAYWIASQRNLWRVERGGVPHPVATGAHGPVRPMYQILKQADGAMWFPVPGVGLGYLRPDWRRIAEFSAERGGLSSDLYRAIVPARAGGLWLVGGSGEVERLDMHGVVHPLDPALQARLQGHEPLAAVEDRNGRLWLGEVGATGALLRVDPDTSEVRQWRVDSGRDATLGGPLDLLEIASDGTLWASHSGAGLQQRDIDTGRVLRTILPGARQGLGVGDTEALGFDSGGALWIAGDDGLARWDASAARLQPVPGIGRGDRVYAFAFDGAERLWLQRLSGLERYERRDGVWRRTALVGSGEGIPAVEGSGLVVDADHRVWLATLRGLYRWDPATERLRRFGLPDGLSSQEFIDGGMTLTDNGVLAAALADGGVVVLDTRVQDPPAQTPGLYWDSIQVRRGGRWIALDAEAPTLQPDDRELRVELRLLAYDNPAGNRYFTRLEGYDAEWVEQGSSGERVFAGLPPGDYSLHARALSAAGDAAAEQVLHFSVLPPWWRTTWALLGAAIALALLGWWLADAWRGRMRRRHALQRAAHERQVAQHASLAKTRFLATLGHEVRTPMTGVLGMSELLLSTGLDPQQRGYTESIRGAGEHLLRLVNDALDLARIESGKLELVDEAYDLHALVADAAALMRPLARQHGLAFEVELASDVPRGVRGDGKRVCQVLLNLLSNSIKFTERGSVTLSVARGRVPADGDSGAGPEDTDALVFVVADTGPGLNAEQKSRLFRRFEQSENARTAARYGGSGLGLAICQELVTTMGGRIVVDSTPGVGTRFQVHLPLSPADCPGEASSDVAPAAVASLAVLLVEDDPTVAEVISGLLRASGHAVTHVAHGLAALTEVTLGDFDAALLDLDLPGIDGFALARQLRAQGFTRPLIAVTARADAEAEPLARAAGFDRFVRKPVTGAMLAAMLEALPASKPATQELSS